MIEDGLLERVKPDISLSVHVLPLAKAGQAVVQQGALWASWDTRVLRISGPAPLLDAPTSSDIARVAAQVTTALYELVEREGHSTDPVTFRVRSLKAEQPGRGAPSQAAIEVHLGRGEPGQAVVEVNLALYDNALRARLLTRIEDVASAIVRAAGGTLSVEVDYALPALVNDDHVTDAVERAAERVIGQANIIRNWRNRFSDDFGLFMAAAPGCLMLLGTANPDKGIAESWHRPSFDIDEDALPVGVQILSLAALHLLQ
jgi:metal-dependent amidase/aminoacylase/carboxypeptidase family protein